MFLVSNSAICVNQKYTSFVQVKIEEQRLEQNVHQQIAGQERNPSHLVRSVTSIRLGVDAERADEQESEEGLADTLKAIVKRTAPNPLYSKYHALHLQRFLSKMGAYTPRWVLCAWLEYTAVQHLTH